MIIILGVALIAGFAAWFFISSSIEDVKNDY